MKVLWLSCDSNLEPPGSVVDGTNRMCHKSANVMTNSVGPDQTAP